MHKIVRITQLTLDLVLCGFPLFKVVRISIRNREQRTRGKANKKLLSLFDCPPRVGDACGCGGRRGADCCETGKDLI